MLVTLALTAVMSSTTPSEKNVMRDFSVKYRFWELAVNGIRTNASSTSLTMEFDDE
jgi:hypothetical protein